MRWIQKIGWRPGRTLRRPGRRERNRTERRAARRRHDPVGRDRSYAAYAASWDELEWEPVWVFAPPVPELDSEARIFPAAPPGANRSASSERTAARVGRSRNPQGRVPVAPARISRSGALLLGLGTTILGLALAPLLPALTPPIRMGLTATAAMALFGSFLVLRSGNGSLEHG